MSTGLPWIYPVASTDVTRSLWAGLWKWIGGHKDSSGTPKRFKMKSSSLWTTSCTRELPILWFKDLTFCSEKNARPQLETNCLSIRVRPHSVLVYVDCRVLFTFFIRGLYGFQGVNSRQRTNNQCVGLTLEHTVNIADSSASTTSCGPYCRTRSMKSSSRATFPEGRELAGNELGAFLAIISGRHRAWTGRDGTIR